MKRQQPKENNAVHERPRLERPELKRLGTLQELTRHFNGGGMDGGLAGMSFP